MCQGADNNLVARRQRAGKSNAISDAQSKYAGCNVRVAVDVTRWNCWAVDTISYIIDGMILPIDSKLKRLSNVPSRVLLVLSSLRSLSVLCAKQATRALAFDCMISLCAKWNLWDRDIPNRSLNGYSPLIA